MLSKKTHDLFIKPSVASWFPGVETPEYCCELLCEGPGDDEVAMGIKNCGPKGLKDGPHQRQWSLFGRVFSGFVSTGLKVRVMGPRQEGRAPLDAGSEDHSDDGHYIEPIEDVP